MDVVVVILAAEATSSGARARERERERARGGKVLRRYFRLSFYGCKEPPVAVSRQVPLGSTVAALYLEVKAARLLPTRLACGLQLLATLGFQGCTYYGVPRHLGYLGTTLPPPLTFPYLPGSRSPGLLLAASACFGSG